MKISTKQVVATTTADRRRFDDVVRQRMRERRLACAKPEALDPADEVPLIEGTEPPKVLPDTKLGDAVSYTLNQWEYVTRDTSDGTMPIDNNILERDIRVFATGRKSWLFSDTVEGAKASAVICSLILTCRACGVDPLAWLRHVLDELPQRATDVRIDDLLPLNFASRTPRP